MRRGSTSSSSRRRRRRGFSNVNIGLGPRLAVAKFAGQSSLLSLRQRTHVEEEAQASSQRTDGQASQRASERSRQQPTNEQMDLRVNEEQRKLDFDFVRSPSLNLSLSREIRLSRGFRNSTVIIQLHRLGTLHGLV